jgi:hypothetical protein
MLKMPLGELDRILVLRTAMLIRTGLAAAAFGLFLFKLDVFVGSVGRESVFHLRAENADVPVAVAAAMPDWQWLRFEPPSKCTARFFPLRASSCARPSHRAIAASFCSV